MEKPYFEAWEVIMLDRDAEKAAKALCDEDIKIKAEAYHEMLALDSVSNRSWRIGKPYSARWFMQNMENRDWLYEHWLCAVEQYCFRFGSAPYSMEEILDCKKTKIFTPQWSCRKTTLYGPVKSYNYRNTHHSTVPRHKAIYINDGRDKKWTTVRTPSWYILPKGA